MSTTTPTRQSRPRSPRPGPAQSNAVARVDPDTAMRNLSAELDRRQGVLADSAASLIDPVKLKGVILSTFSRTPSLWDCDPISIARAVVEAAQVGLEPTGSLGGAYLVPFWNSKTNRREAQLIIGYTGFVKLARRSGEIIKVEARIVRATDEFDYGYGLEPYLNHRPNLTPIPDTDNPITHAYAVAFFRSGERQFDVMSIAEILVIKARSKSKDRDGKPTGPWVTDEAEMIKKTPLRRMSKMLPLTVEAQRLLDAEDDYDPSGGVRVVPATRKAIAAPSRIASRVLGTGDAPTATATPTAAPAATAATTGDGDPGPSEPARAAGTPSEAGASASVPASDLPDTPAADPATGEVVEGEFSDAEDELCGDASPYDDGATCIRDAGHDIKTHKGPDGATW